MLCVGVASLLLPSEACEVARRFRASLRGWLGGPRPLWVPTAAGSAGRATFPGCGCASELRAAQTPHPQPSSAFLFKSSVATSQSHFLA